MLTTTPFLSPREGCEPMPSTSTVPSRPASPTSATTLEVPMSRPMIRLLSSRLGIARLLVALRAACRAAAPTDREPARIAHVHVGDVGRALRDDLHRGGHERLEALIDLLAAQAHRDAVVEIELPGAARIEAQGREAHAALGETAVHRQIAQRDGHLAPIRSGELRQLERNVPRLAREQLASGIEKTAVAPA